ncbi:MAG: single-stranded-DNA-specific exonuclease RecJ [Chloroflexi bacterium]|nr:single-stranded-DNA-specific exonuclease RecJ [Chloroflexota bacterium]
MPLEKRWIVAPKTPPDHLAKYREMSPIVAQVLYNRGLTDPADAYRFLHADDLSSGSLLTLKGKRPSIDRALARIRQAIRANEQIIVYGDFDADGVTSTALLVEALKALGARVAPYIPHRVDEGYGVNNEALLKLARAGVKLVITVDCGIRSVDEVEEGRALGLDIIVTDHHSLGPELPKAYAVINPKCDDAQYTEDMLAGVGVAYRLAEALFTIAGAGQPKNANGRPLTPDDFLDLVAIGTVADLAPLNRLENRMLVKRGLKVMNETKRAGLRALAEVAQLKMGSIDAGSIGFGIGPRINAARRLDNAMLAYELLATTDPNKAGQLAVRLQTLNLQRQELTRAAQDMIREKIEDPEGMPLIFAGDRGFQPGIVGLVAGRLTEEFYRPAVVMEEGDTESRASCRSIPQFDITHALDQCATLLVRHGGHAQAAGFTILNENIPEFRDKLMALARNALRGQDLLPTLEIDMEVEAADISLDLALELRQLEPTGHMNPTPTLVTRNLRVQDWRTVGQKDQHLKLRLGRPGLGQLDAIGFNLADNWNAKNGDYVDVAYQLEINEWNGNTTAQLRLLDVKRTGSW